MHYTGGGHAYLLLSNTDETRRKLGQFERETNLWLLETFGIALYLAGGGTACSTNDQQNQPEGSYRGIFRHVSTEISERKLHRYSMAQINTLSAAAGREGVRECSRCHRMDRLGEGEKCAVCAGLDAFSREIQNKNFFAVTRTRPGDAALPLPRGVFLTT